MAITGGESNESGDMADVWCFSFREHKWYQPNLEGKAITPKRFHTACSFD